MEGRWVKSYDNVTTLSPGSIVVLLVAIVVCFVVPRRFLFLPLLLVTSFIPISERLVIFGMDFAFLRLMTVLCWIRLVVRGEVRRLKWSRIDQLFIAWVVWRIVATTLRTAAFGPLVRQLGGSIETLGIFFLVRMIVRSWRDIDALILSFAVVAFPVSLAMFSEYQTGWNVASLFSETLQGISIDREGAIRASCGYAHPLIAGAVWASVAPLICARWWNPRANRVFTLASLGAALVCVVASSSSTPMLGLALGFLASWTWLVRDRMNWVRWGIVAGVIVVQLIMSKPIWHLFQRVTAVGVSGSTGYQRYLLFDNFVRRFTDWAPIGLNSTAYWGRQMDDLTNVFIAQAVAGGLVGLSIFIALFVTLYSHNGKLLALYRARRQRVQEVYLFALGISLFVHIAMMNAMGYLWQIQLPWFACFAMIASAPIPRAQARADRVRSRPLARPQGAAERGGLPA